MNYAEIICLLKTEFPLSIDINTKIKSILEEKKILKEKKDTKELINCWFAIISLQIIRSYKESFSLLKSREYKKAWDILEEIENSFHNIKFNNIDYSNYNILNYIEKYVNKFQALYPYKVFLSPEYLETRVECSICGSDMNPFEACTHIPGKVYDGDMCSTIVHEGNFISASLVTNPVQKYSAVYDDIENPKRYPILEYLLPRLDNEYISWDFMIIIKRRPHKEYNVGRNEKCPCLSGKKYKKCCLLNPDGVAYPHYEFLLPEEIINKHNPGFNKSDNLNVKQ